MSGSARGYYEIEQELRGRVARVERAVRDALYLVPDGGAEDRVRLGRGTASGARRSRSAASLGLTNRMAQRLTEEEFEQLINHERDPFKLAVRGFAAIEADIEAGIAAVFPGDVPPEVRRLPLRTLVALGIALGVVPEVFKDGISRLGELRNDFAHGHINELNRQRARGIWGGFTPALGEQNLGPTLEAHPPVLTLRAALAVTRTAVQQWTQAATQRRAEEQRIVGMHHALRARLQQLEDERPDD